MVNDMPFIDARVLAVGWERVVRGDEPNGATVEMWNGSVLKCRAGAR
jgi:hypothetical protein